jgi:hypothetical protein
MFYPGLIISGALFSENIFSNPKWGYSFRFFTPPPPNDLFWEEKTALRRDFLDFFDTKEIRNPQYKSWGKRIYYFGPEIPCPILKCMNKLCRFRKKRKHYCTLVHNPL